MNIIKPLGISTHTQSGCSFTVNDEFRNKINKQYIMKKNNLILYGGLKLALGLHTQGCAIHFSSIQSSIINTLCFNSFSNNLEYPRW